MVTQKQIALKLGISQKTVSRAINGQPGVKPTIRELILAETKNSGYTPNLNARNLNSQRTHMIAVIIPTQSTFNSLYFLQTFKGIAEAAKQHGYTLQFVNAEDSTDLSSDIGGTEAIVLYSIGTENARTTSIIQTIRRDLNIPLIIIQTDQRQDSIPCISMDNFTGGYLATLHLLKLGHQRIAYLCSPQEISPESIERARGYQAALIKYGIQPKQCDQISIANNEMGNEFEKAFGKKSALKYSAFFIWSDAKARVLAYEAKIRGINIPDELSIVGFDDNQAYSLMSHPHLSTIRQPLFELGQKSTLALIEHLDKQTPLTSSIIIPELITRDSCAAYNKNTNTKEKK